MDEIKRALLGDREAQRAVTERGELLPCPFCNEKMRKIKNGKYFSHPINGCYVQAFCFETDDKELIADWNTRTQILTAEELERLEGLE